MKFRLAALLMAAAMMPLLARAQNQGSLRVKASPGRAGVFLDGKYLGPAANFRIARTYPATASEHEVKLIDPRFEELTTRVTIRPGKKTTISQALKALALPKPPFGMLRTRNADKFAAVYVNENFMGHAGEFNNRLQALLLSPGEYSVRIVPATGQPIRQQVKIEANKTILVK